MTRTISAAAALLAIVAIAALGVSAAPAGARVTIGIGQQSPQVFSSPYWRALHEPDMRYITPWDTIDDPAQLAQLDVWMTAARAAGARVMLGFEHSLRSRRLARELPGPARFARAFRALHRRYPEVRDWVPWNETNDPLALTGRNPARAAAYFDIVSRNCRGCDVVAGDVLDLPNMASWIRRFQAHIHEPARIWGLHNYHDANSLTSASTRLLLSLVRGQIWFTETGGVVRMRVLDRGRMRTVVYGERHAAQATRHALELARLSPRITRIYLYHWLAPARFTTWDSALTSSRMHPRPAYRALRRWLAQARRTGLAR